MSTLQLRRAIARFADLTARAARRATDLVETRTATVVPLLIVLLSASAISLAVMGAPTDSANQLDGLAAGWDGAPRPAAVEASIDPGEADVRDEAGRGSSLTAELTGPLADDATADEDADQAETDAGGPSDVAASGDAGDPATPEPADTATAEGSSPTEGVEAVLHIVAGGVDVVRGGTSTSAAGGERLGPGDVVVTDRAGVAEVAYPDGSLTRIGAGSRFELEALATNPTRVRVSLDVGSTWHRVRDLTRSGGSFEVETEMGVAAVRGTAFAVLCTPGRCGVAVAEGRVDVRAAAAVGTAILRPGDAVRVSRQQLGDIEPPTGDLAAALTENIARDRAAGLPPPDPSQRGADAPGRPDTPGKPDAAPEKPDDAGNGDPPAKPDTPRQPEPPGKPDDAGNADPPAEPDTPRQPDPPGKPTAPGDPGDAGEPGAPPKPDTPGKPENAGDSEDAAPPSDPGGQRRGSGSVSTPSPAATGRAADLRQSGEQPDPSTVVG